MMITNNKLKFYGDHLCLDKQRLNEDAIKPFRFLVNGQVKGGSYPYLRHGNFLLL